MPRLTWQNVAAPDLSTAASAYSQVGRNIQNAFTGFGDIARNIARDRMNAASNAELARLAQVGGADQVDAYLQGLTGRIDPNQMNEGLINAVMGLRGNAQGYDTTRINQANTQSVMDQRIQETNHRNQLREQSVGFNQALNEAFQQQEAGNYTRADEIISDAIKQFPAAAGAADMGALDRSMRSIRSAPDAGRFTESGQRYEQNKSPIIETAVSTGFDEQSVKTTAFEEARNRGLTVEQATRVADEAFEVWKSGSNMGTVPGLTTPSPSTEASPVDRIIGSPDPSVVQAPVQDQQVQAVPTPTSLGGIPVQPAPEEAVSPVDRYLTPSEPQVPAEAVREPVAAAEPTNTTRMTDPEYVRQSVQENPAEVVNSVLSEVQAFDDELNMQGSSSVEEAYRIYSSTDGVETEENNLYRDLSDDDKAKARGLFDSAVREVARKANVSPKVAKAALLSTLDTRSWYGSLTVPQPSISRATSVAGTISDPQQSRALSDRTARLSSFRENLNKEQELLTTDAARLQDLRTRRPAMMSQDGYEKAVKYYEDRVAQRATKIAGLTQDARRLTTLPLGNESSPRQGSSQPSIREQGTAPSRVVGGAETGNPTVDQIAPALREAGLSNAEIVRQSDNIQSDVDRIIRESGKDSRTYDMVQNAVDSIISQYTDRVNPALINQMSPDEIIESALSDDSVPYSNQRDAAVWGNIKKALPNTKEFEPFKDMSARELKQAAPRLLPLLRARADETRVDPSNVVDRIIDKYTR